MEEEGELSSEEEVELETAVGRSVGETAESERIDELKMKTDGLEAGHKPGIEDNEEDDGDRVSKEKLQALGECGTPHPIRIAWSPIS